MELDAKDHKLVVKLVYNPYLIRNMRLKATYAYFTVKFTCLTWGVDVTWRMGCWLPMIKIRFTTFVRRETNF